MLSCENFKQRSTLQVPRREERRETGPVLETNKLFEKTLPLKTPLNQKPYSFKKIMAFHRNNEQHRPLSITVLIISIMLFLKLFGFALTCVFKPFPT